MGIVVGPSCIGTKGIVVIIGDGEDRNQGTVKSHAFWSLKVKYVTST